MTNLPLVVARLIGAPLVVARVKLELVLPAVLPRILGQAARIEAPSEPAERPALTQADRIAIIPVFGTLVARGQGMIALSGMTSYEALSVELEAARIDARVAGILLDIDSPGGEAAGMAELSEQIAALNRKKPVWA